MLIESSGLYRVVTSAAATTAPPAPWENLDYIMHPVEARGPWLKVRVAQPPDTCIRLEEVRSRVTIA
jgi:hypothetical protein